MDYIFSYIKEIVFYLLVMSAVLNIMPDSSYQKYVKRFFGIVLIIMMLKPLNFITDFNGNLELFYNKNEMNRQLSEIEKKLSSVEQSVNETLVEEYEQLITEQLKDYVESQDFYIDHVNIELRENTSSQGIELNVIDIYIKKDKKDIHKIDKIKVIKEDQREENSSDELNNSNENNSYGVYEGLIQKYISDYYRIEPERVRVTII